MKLPGPPTRYWILPSFCLLTTNCHGRALTDLSNVTSAHSVALVHPSLANVYLASLRTTDISFLAVAGMMAMSLIVLGIASIRPTRRRASLESEAANPTRIRGIGTRTIRTAAIVTCFMCVFEISKMALFPNMGMWVSHSITIVVVTLLVAIASFAVLKNQELLHLEMASNEQRYRLLFERSLAGAYMTALDGRILDCNVSFCRMFGYETREEVIGKSVAVGYFNPSDRAQLLEQLRARKDLTNFEQCLRRKDGSPVWVLNSATLVTSQHGTEPIIKGTLTDITERKRIEQEHRRLAVIVGSSTDAILSQTMDGVIETWNPGAERMFGYSAAEVIGKSITMLALKGRSKVIQRNLEEVGRRCKVESLESIGVRKDGREIPIAFSLSPIADAAGKVVGGAVVARDITEQKHAETALRQSEEQYRLLFETNPIPMWVFDRTTFRFLAVNTAAIRQYGYREDEFLAMTIADIRPDETVPAVIDHVAKRTSGLQEPSVWKHRRKNGTIIDVEIVSHDLNFHGTAAVFVAAHDITEQKRAEERLQESESKYRVLFEDSADAYWLMDETSFVDCNAAGLQLLGFSSKAEFRHPADFSPPNQPDGTPSRVAADERIAAAMEKGKERFEWLHRRKNGETFPAEVCLSALKLGGRPMLLAAARDISDRKHAEETARQAEEKYRAIFDNSVVGIFQATQEGRPLSFNRAMAQMHGYESPEELLADVSNVALQLFVDPGRMSEMAEVAISDGVLRGAELEVYRKDRSRTWVRVNVRAVHEPVTGRLIFEGTAEDIGDRKAAEAQVQFLAYYDALTGLPNRALLKDRLIQAVAGARRRNEKVAFLFLDLDRFKLINDSLGPTLGDLLLKDVAERLKRCVREQDTVARVGGDEFAIVLSSVNDTADAAITATRIVKTITERFGIEGHILSTSCSIGISMFPDHGADWETLIKYADQAMSSAKEHGRNNFRFFTNDLNIQAVEQLNLEADLRLALEKSEFFLVYQPQMDIATGQIIGFEALIRWQHPRLGLVPPNDFIPIAEKNGLILPIGEWVLRTACAQARGWYKDGSVATPVAVNVSAVQFRQERFSEQIRSILLETGLPPQYLELELTESLLLSNADVMFPVLQELRKMGLKLSLDDFGTGYSSLSYLKQFRVNKLKIDRSFIRDIAMDTDDAAITTAVISMAKSLHLKVLAEGVEDETQMSFLREHQCDEIQGYYFSKPLLPGEITDFLSRAEVREPLFTGQSPPASRNLQGENAESALTPRKPEVPSERMFGNSRFIN